MTEFHVEIEFYPNRWIWRWQAWVRSGSGFPYEVAWAVTRGGAERAGRRRLRKRLRPPKPPEPEPAERYHLDQP